MQTLLNPPGISPAVHLYFRAMPSEVQRGAIHRLALTGMSAEDIAARTGWSVEQVRSAIEEERMRPEVLPSRPF